MSRLLPWQANLLAKHVAAQRDSVTVYIRRSRTRFPRKRAQQWYWVAQSANGQTVGRSTEMYTNRGDCVAMAHKLFQTTRPWPVIDRWEEVR